MEHLTYALAERIGHPALFCGREREMNLLLGWCDHIPKQLAHSRALLGRRKCGKTAIMQRHQGIPDDVLDLIFRSRYEYEIEKVERDVAGELQAKIRRLEQDKHSLRGALSV